MLLSSPGFPPRPGSALALELASPWLLPGLGATVCSVVVWCSVRAALPRLLSVPTVASAAVHAPASQVAAGRLVPTHLLCTPPAPVLHRLSQHWLPSDSAFPCRYDEAGRAFGGCPRGGVAPRPPASWAPPAGPERSSCPGPPPPEVSEADPSPLCLFCWVVARVPCQLAC